MLARHSNPIEISSPELVVRPLWQATHRSDVRKKAPGGVLSPFAFSVGVVPCSIAATATAPIPRTIAPRQRRLIASLSITFHPPDPKGDTSAPAAFALVYLLAVPLRQSLSVRAVACLQ